MRAGKLSHRLIIDEPVTTQDASGDPVKNWVTRATVWGSIEPLSGRESLLAAQMLVSANARITVRWGPATRAMSEKWRVRFGSRIYDIVLITNKAEADRELVLLAKSGTNEG